MDLDDHIARWVQEGHLTADQAMRLRASAKAGALPSQLGLLTIAGVANGIALILFAVWYSVPFAAHALLVLWLLSLLPLLYFVRSRALAGLTGLVFVLWLPAFALRETGVAVFTGSSVMPVVFLMGGTALFALGGLHYLAPSLAPVARGLRIIALVTVSLALFVLGLSFWSGRSGGTVVPLTGGTLWSSVLVLAAVAAAATGAGIFLRKRAPMITRAEGPVSLGLIAVGLVYFAVPLPVWVFVLTFNVLTVAMLAVLLVTGWQRADVRAMDIANIGLMAVFVSRWLDLGLGQLSFGPFAAVGLVGMLSLGGFLTWRRHAVVDSARARSAGQPQPEP